jgi:hypothetical protein
MSSKRARRQFCTPNSALPTGISRRDLMKLSALGLVGYSQSGWLKALAEGTASDPKRKRACILLWMTGGPSQMDTFDLKPGHKNGGPIKPIETAVPGVKISEHLPKLAKMMQHVVPVRSMTTKEGDHTRATYLLRTGYLPQGPIHYHPCRNRWPVVLGWKNPVVM